MRVLLVITLLLTLACDRSSRGCMIEARPWQLSSDEVDEFWHLVSKNGQLRMWDQKELRVALRVGFGAYQDVSSHWLNRHLETINEAVGRSFLIRDEGFNHDIMVWMDSKPAIKVNPNIKQSAKDFILSSAGTAGYEIGEFDEAVQQSSQITVSLAGDLTTVIDVLGHELMHAMGFSGHPERSVSILNKGLTAIDFTLTDKSWLWLLYSGCFQPGMAEAEFRRQLSILGMNDA